MALEVRQNALENEMNAAKDTIWRLTNRIYSLEKEVGLLKNFIQKATKSPTPSGPPVSAKLAEITRRKQTLTGFRNNQKKDLKYVKVKAGTSLSNQSNGDSSVTPVENPSQIIIKNEPLSEDEMPSNVRNVIHHSLQGPDLKPNLKRHSKTTSLEGKRIKVLQSDQSNSSDSEGSSTEASDVKDEDFVPTGSALSKVRNSNVRLGRPKCPTWKYFKRIKLPANKGNCRFLAVCKICKIEVSGRADRLKPHITKCLAKYIARGKKIPGIGSGHVTKKVIPKRKPVQVMQSAPSTTTSDFNRTFTRGRKKAHQVWQYYTETVSDSVENGGERFMAICKNCGQEVSRKTDRLQGHVKRCLGIEFVGSHEIRVNCKKEAYDYEETKSAPGSTNVRITSSQSVAVNPSQIPSASGSSSEDSENGFESVIPAAPINALGKPAQENQKSEVHLQELQEPQVNQFNINAEENQCQPLSIGETRTS